MRYKVGKPHYKLSFIYSFIIIFWAVFLIIYSPFSGMNICGFMLIFLIIFIFLPSMAFCNNIWEVDEHYLKYTFYNNVIDKSQAFFKTIFTRNMEYQMKIKLDKIISIQVTYEAVPMLFYGTNGYNVIFKVLMKDGSSFSFQPIVTRKRKEIIDAIEFLKSKGIIFKDKYHILDQLDKQEALSYYLEKIHGGKK